MLDFITDRTQAEVDRCKELAAKGWNNMTEAEKAEWYGTAMRGAYNYTDLNRVETAVAELSGFLDMGLTTKTNWSMWITPDAADMNRYASNLQQVNTKYGTGFNIPSAMNNLTHTTANNIEKMLKAAYEKMDASSAWEKKSASVEYDWLYTRNDDAMAGQTGTDTQWSFYGGMISATRTLAFDSRTGFNRRNVDIGLLDAAGKYIISDDRCVARMITYARATGNTKDGHAGSTMYEIEYKYEIAGYATRKEHAYCSVGSQSYGRVLVPKNSLPNGTLIDGSLAAGYCYMQDANGSYYYYELC